jgi:hypothetical protein
MLNFCTLFDSNYAAKGIAMYHSLLKHCKEFHLYIFAFDETIYEALLILKLPKVTVISLANFEDENLLSIKESRTKAEYCWTCTSSTILYCIEIYQLPHCTYLDADLYFYSNPGVLINEIGDSDVLITLHRYTPEFDVSKDAGKYCVQFITFKNTINGLKALNWWRNACLNWCYARVEDGKFGDQKYLDDWTSRFEGIHVLENLGGGVAPWNMQQYTFSKKKEKILGLEINSGKSFELVFFHFHALLSLRKGIMHELFIERYPTPNSVRQLIYKPYVRQLKKEYKRLKFINKSINGIATREMEYSWLKYLKTIRKRILRKENKYFYWLAR